MHQDIVYHPHKHIPFASISKEFAERTITLCSPSKSFNLAGLNSAFAIIANPQLRERFRRLIESIHIPIGNIFGLTAATAAYEQGEEWLNALNNYLSENVKATLDYIEEELPDIEAFHPEGTYLLWLNFARYQMSTNELQNFLIQKARVGLSGGTFFGMEGEGFMRMNMATHRPLIMQALNQIKQSSSV